jgi:hypothetical protein
VSEFQCPVATCRADISDCTTSLSTCHFQLNNSLEAQRNDISISSSCLKLSNDRERQNLCSLKGSKNKMPETNTMEQSPSRAKSSSIGQQLSQILWYLKVHYHIHNSPPTTPAHNWLTFK